jgi:mannitol-1-phosphate 5-dehydrogenase
MKAVVIGPGRVGCGFVGQLLRASGYSVLFVGRDRQTLTYLNRAGRYRLRLVQEARIEEVIVDGVRAIAGSERRKLIGALAEADVIATAVGAANLPAVAALIADGLRRRRRPACVLAFENRPDAGPYLRTLVGRHLPDADAVVRHGFASALVSRVVSRKIIEPDDDLSLTFVGDPPATFVIDGRDLRHPPAITGMTVAADYPACLRRKLFTYSAGHATCAYLGYLKGYRYIHSAVRDPEIRRTVLEAMAEGQRGLAVAYGPAFAGGRAELHGILARFDNAALDDPIARVARDPLRKLNPQDRLVGAARLASRAGVTPTSLATAVAAALLYSDPADAESVTVRRELDSIGVHRALERFSGIGHRSAFGRLVVAAYGRLAGGWWPDNRLLSLENVIWAWHPPRQPQRRALLQRLSAFSPPEEPAPHLARVIPPAPQEQSPAGGGRSKSKGGLLRPARRAEAGIARDLGP